MPTEMELTLEQTQQGVSHEVSCCCFESSGMRTVCAAVKPCQGRFSELYLKYTQARTPDDSIEIAGSTFAWNYFSRISTLSSDNQSLLLQYSRDGYVIEGELKEYEDSCEKSSVQIKFEDKDFIQDSLKILVAQKKIKLAFENADLSSRVELITSEIKRSILSYRGRKLYQERYVTRSSSAFIKNSQCFRASKEKKNN
ncbi:hypothetical protein Tco_0628288 [Tanacetum coccineum]|uniref:Uncharacterized protein n=1 Tax=Tanacetum coccineum TaxID=301880 RepID=A0ABQ4WPV2_9ASTR